MVYEKQGTIYRDFNVIFSTNKRENICIKIEEQELDVELYLDRIEECYGLHEMWEVTDSEVDRVIENFIDNFDDIELVEELAEDELMDNEYVISINSVEVV